MRVRSFASPVPRSEVALYGRALPGERISGDDALFVRGEEHLLLAVADGLGHGPEARAASRAVMDALVRSDPGAPLKELLASSAAAAEGTRGAVLTLVRLDLLTRQLEHLGVGDVRTLLCGPGKVEVLAGSAALLSGRGREVPRARGTQAALSPHGALLVFTDGLRSIAAPGPASGTDPVALAHELASGFARATDDLLVLAAR